MVSGSARGERRRGHGGEVVELKDVELVSRFLRADPVANAYQLGDLDPLYLPYCRWFADSATEPRAVVLVYRGLSLPVLLTSGEAPALNETLRGVRHVVPERFQYQIHDPHLSVVEQFFRLTTRARMLRMALTRESYRRPQAVAAEVVQLGHRDTARIAELYQHYPDNFFEPFQLESGLYFGVFRGEQLVSIAGIHALSEQYDVAVIGNLVTLPELRGQGLATACTRRLLDALFARVGLVALNTAESNTAAIRTFERLGFSEHLRYLEGRAERP